ncbi:hypothetical protein GCM10022286_27710 [Gryllotalpicola daejeonensis]|uniref:DUF2795 domain-containing protein n=1 Tax=Gryllotalpicola daejeonensis TaxID=993087 RepID=A0ABP7ZMU3_9MICO
MAETPDPDEVLGYVAGQLYPANLPALIDRAGINGAPDEVLDLLRRLPDLDYNGPTAVRRVLIELDAPDD